MDKSEVEYLKGGMQPLATESSVLVSSSKYLNSAAMRNLVAQEMLRKYGTDLTPAYFIPEMNAAFAEVTDYAYIASLVAAERERLPEFASWLDRRFISDFSVERVADFRTGTLGEQVNAFVNSGFDIDFMFKGQPADDYQYWLKRFIQSHDIQHMVTGFDVTPIGEYALIQLNNTNYYDYFSPELASELTRQTTLQVTCGWMRANLHYPCTVPLLLDALALGREMGRGLSKPLFYVKWEDYWDNSIAEIREDLNIQGAPAAGAWAWAYEEMQKG